MKRLFALFSIVVLSTATANAEDLDKIPSDEAQQWGARFAEMAAKIENAPVKISRFLGRTKAVHNIYLQILVELGIQGLLALLILIVVPSLLSVYEDVHQRLSNWVGGADPEARQGALARSTR